MLRPAALPAHTQADHVAALVGIAMFGGDLVPLGLEGQRRPAVELVAQARFGIDDVVDLIDEGGAQLTLGLQLQVLAI